MDRSKTMGPLLLAPKHASQMMGISPRKLWGMTFEDRPGLPHVRCGRLVRYPVTDLEQWIRDQKQEGK